MQPEMIQCLACDGDCGKIYPATHTDPSYREGIGENFTTADGGWCCSGFCRDAMNGVYDEESTDA